VLSALVPQREVMKRHFGNAVAAVGEQTTRMIATWDG
jgi:hypothetical protein